MKKLHVGDGQIQLRRVKIGAPNGAHGQRDGADHAVFVHEFIQAWDASVLFGHFHGRTREFTFAETGDHAAENIVQGLVEPIRFGFLPLGEIGGVQIPSFSLSVDEVVDGCAGAFIQRGEPGIFHSLLKGSLERFLAVDDAELILEFFRLEVNFELGPIVGLEIGQLQFHFKLLLINVQI